jgi:hypothetical protein
MDKFSLDCSELLKENGILIILDTSLSWYEIYSYIRNRKHLFNSCLLSGKKRSINNIKNHSNKHFLLKQCSLYDSEINNLKVMNFLNVPLNITPTWQSLILTKR